MTLSEHLSQAYGSLAMGKRPIAEVVAAFAADAAGNPDLITEAHAEMDRLTDSITERCVISRAHRDFLRLALA